MGFNEKKEGPEQDGVPKVEGVVRLGRPTAFHDLSGGALAENAGILTKFQIKQVLVHSDTDLVDTTITVKFDSLSGVNYDVALGELDFDGQKDLGFIAGENMLGAFGEAGDDIKIISSGTDVVGILYITIIYQKLA